jgi:3',5'-cyclic AMP phosphodiesterase CpdA
MTTVKAARTFPEDVGRSLTVVHLSDLHFGPSHRFGSQVTAGGDRVRGGQSLLDSLKADLTSVLTNEESGPSAPVLIAVTGDLTDAAKPEQFRDAGVFILGLENSLEDRTASTVIVPGNHDVLWEEPDIEDRLLAWRGFARDRIQRVVGLREHPFALVLDDYTASHGTIIAAINSAGFVEKDKPDQNRGRISDDGIEDLDDQLKSLPENDNSLRIALVHHHPILIPDLVEDRRGYDAIVDGGDLLRVLRRHGFHLVLHGHKHLPFQFSEDSRAAYSTRQPREQRPILVVCGGSVGSTELSDRMQTPTNYYNIIHVKWLPMSGECRSRIEPRQLVRYDDSGAPLLRRKWHWEPCLPDDRCYEAQPPEWDNVLRQIQTASFTDSRVDDTPRTNTYGTSRGAFPVVEIRPSLDPSQAHEANVWIVRHRIPSGAPDEPLVKVVWSAGKQHDVMTVSGDPSGRFDAVFNYYGPMLVMANLTFADGYCSTQYIYVQMRRRFPTEED